MENFATIEGIGIKSYTDMKFLSVYTIMLKKKSKLQGKVYTILAFKNDMDI